MILGIGSDVCFVSGIRRSLSRFGDAYLEHLFSPAEREPCDAGVDPSSLYARAFCGKEACAKALGTGMSEGVGWRDIEVIQTPPLAVLCLSGGALEWLVRITPTGHKPVLHISCSGDSQIATATAVITAVPTHKT